MRNYKYRLYPTKAQERLLNDHLNSCRLVYNKCLETKIKHYEETKKYLSKFAVNNLVKDWKEAEPLHSQVAQEVSARVDKAFYAFFQRVKKGDTPGFPRFKGYGRYDSYCYPQSGWKLGEYKLRLSKIGEVKIKKHREITGNIKTCTVKRENGNEWYAVFSVEEPKKKKPNHKNEKVIAYDLGVKHFAVSSDSEYIDNPKFYNSKLKELRKVQKKYSELKNLPSEDKKKQKVKNKLVKLHKKVKNQRKDFLHKLSRNIVNDYQYVIVEDLHTKTMTRKNSYYKLNRYIMDCGWNQFTNMLEYKAEEAGGQVVKVNPRHTSQRCSNCGMDVPKDLNERKHKCYSCGIELDRDLNAAYNILSLGRQALGLTSLDAARLKT